MTCPLRSKSHEQKAIWHGVRRGIWAVTLLSLLLFGAFILFWLHDQHRMAQLNSTHEGPLSGYAWSGDNNQPETLFARLKPAQGADNLRFIAMPSFGKRWFAISVGIVKDQGVGEAVVTRRSGEVIRHETFTLAKSDVLFFLHQWDAMVDGYAGEARLQTDGTLLEFERHRGPRITSGSGNSRCHYDVLGDRAAQAFGRYVPELADLRNPQLAMLLKTRSCSPPIFDWR